MINLKYYNEAQALRKQQKAQQIQQEQFRTAEKNMKSWQIKCRALPHCRLAQTKFCFACKMNRASLNPQQDYFKPKIPGIKIF